MGAGGLKVTVRGGTGGEDAVMIFKSLCRYCAYVEGIHTITTLYPG